MLHFIVTTCYTKNLEIVNNQAKKSTLISWEKSLHANIVYLPAACGHSKAQRRGRNTRTNYCARVKTRLCADMPTVTQRTIQTPFQKRWSLYFYRKIKCVLHPLESVFTRRLKNRTNLIIKSIWWILGPSV